MLAASWVIGHSQRVQAGRLSLRIAALLRTTSYPTVRFNGSQRKPPRQQCYTAGLANQLGFEDVSKENMDSDAEMTLLRTRGISQEMLTKLVKQGEYTDADLVLSELLELGVDVWPNQLYEKAILDVLRRPDPENQVGALSDWLNLLPDSKDATPEAFQQILSLLTDSAQRKLPLIIRFGVSCAGKGYMGRVEKEVVPLVARLADPGTLAQFTSNIYMAARRYRQTLRAIHPNIDKEKVDSLVFEETIDDYATVLAEAHPPSPSTLELLEATLPELLPEPLPEDASIFENASDYDYRANPVALTVPLYPSDYTLSTHTLMQLLMTHKIDEAYNLLLELNGLHVPIPPSSIFEAAAKHVLHNSLQSGSQLITQDQIDRFQAFFSLIPPAHLSDIPRQFRELRKLIIDTQLPNMACIIRFAIILSSKGYADLIINHAVAPIMRFTSPAVNRKFLDDFLAANRKYWASYKPCDLEYMAQKTRTNVVGSAIRTLVYSRRLEDALALLPDPTQETYRLTVYTYGVLRSGLEKSSNRTLRGRISEIDALRENEETCVLVEREKGKNLTIRAEEVSMASEWDTAAPVDVNKNLALSLRYLKRCMSGSEELPHPFTIVAFMESYISTGRTTALQLLLNKAIRSSFRSTSVFLFAEMLFYRRRGLNDLVLETFVDHFYLSGVPRQDVLTRHRRVQRVRAQHTEESEYGEDSPARRLCEVSGLSRGKIWPSTVHCNLVWHALVDIAPDNRTIESLYEKLLAITKCAQSNVSTPLLKDSISHLPPPINQQKLGSGAFTPFMRPLMLVHGPSRGAHILGDMMKVGIKPTVYHFTELAGRYASNSDTRRALMVLDRMEKMLEAQNAAESSTEMITDPEDISVTGTVLASTDAAADSPRQSLPPTKTSFPTPDLVMYISLLRGFIKSHNLEGATEVEKRLIQRYTHIPGEYAYLDSVFADLHVLRKQKGAHMRQPAERSTA